LWGEQPRRALRRRSGVGWKPQPAREQAQRLTLPAPKPFKKPLRAPWRASGYEHIAGRVIVLLRGGGQHPGHQQDESQSQRKEFRLNQREHDAMPTLDYHNCKRLITAAPTPATTTHTPAGAVLDLEVQCPLVRPRSEQNRSLGVLTSPAFGECRHRGLARLGIAVRRGTIFVVSESQRPHPGRAYGRCIGFEDAADYYTISQHVEIVLVPLARRPALGPPQNVCYLHGRPFPAPTAGKDRQSAFGIARGRATT
jgi:hypothetical protein